MAIKKNDPIPADNHILRYIKWNNLCKDENNVVIGVLAEAFKERDTESYLSANWLEYFPGNQQQQTICAVQELRKCFRVKPKECFAIGKVGDIKSACAKYNTVKIHIVSKPTNANKSHVSVKMYPNDNILIQ